MDTPFILDRVGLFTALCESRRAEVESQALAAGWGLYRLDLNHVFGQEEMYSSVLRALGFPPMTGLSFDSCRDWARELRGRPEKWAVLCITGADEFFERGLLPSVELVHLLTALAADLLHVNPSPPQHRVGLQAIFFGSGRNYPEDVE
jgi:hypothetical protein